jgi:hypothetical protein
MKRFRGNFNQGALRWATWYTVHKEQLRVKDAFIAGLDVSLFSVTAQHVAEVKPLADPGEVRDKFWEEKSWVTENILVPCHLLRVWGNGCPIHGADLLERPGKPCCWRKGKRIPEWYDKVLAFLAEMSERLQQSSMG